MREGINTEDENLEKNKCFMNIRWLFVKLTNLYIFIYIYIFWILNSFPILAYKNYSVHLT